MKNTFKFLLLLLSLICFDFKLRAQDVYKGNPWLISFGGNLIIEDGSQFKGYINNEPIKWNLSPFTFGAEKRLNNGFALAGNIGSNIFPEKQKISNESLKTSSDVIFIDFYAKYNFNAILKDTSNFDPFLEIGPGYMFKKGQNATSINLCFGFNYWINNKFAIAAAAAYKFGLIYAPDAQKDNLFHMNVMLIQIID